MNAERARSALSQLAQARAELDDFARKYNGLVAELKANSNVKIAVEGVRQSTPEQELRRRATVYYQFAGLDRTRAVAISNEISKAGWHIPGQQKVSNRVNEVRYSPNDIKVAELLQQDANAALQAQNLKISLKLQESREVKQGIPEIWIYEP